MTDAISAVDATGVPVREGIYGDRIGAVEPGGIGYIPDAERHGKPLKLFWTWSSPNWQFPTMYIGVIAVAIFGGGFWPSLIAIVLGTALGAVLLAVFSTWGPRFGVPQLVQSRGAFGFLGNLLPAGLATLAGGVGWFAVYTISGAFALDSLTHLGFQGCLLIIMGAQVMIGFIGHNLIHELQKWAFPGLALIFTLATLVILANAIPSQDFNSDAPLASGGPTGAFSLAFFVAFSYAASWAGGAMDYSRYLPRQTSVSAIFWACGLGLFVACVVPEIGGVALATVVGTVWGPTDSPTDQLIKPLPAFLASMTLLATALGAICANALNLYSGALQFLALGARLGNLKHQRAIVALVLGGLGYVVSRLGEVDAGRSYESFLLVIGYIEMPCLAVVLTDYWLRRGTYRLSEFYDRSHAAWAGVVAVLVGVAASTPFWNQSLYTGVVATAIPQLGDLSFVVSFVVSSCVYFFLARRRVAVSPGTTLERT